MTQTDAKGDIVVFEGKVVEALPESKYMVEIEIQPGFMYKIECYVKGKMNMHHIRIQLGDTVRIETSAYDPKRGRIIYKIDNRRPRFNEGKKQR